jgi:broad specificity phosphatase PhoE
LTRTTSNPELLLIRHATTDLAGKLCGHLDPPLNDEGRAQAMKLVKVLGETEIRHIYSSDLRRAVETAAPLGESLKIPVLTRSNLREISFGDWEGKRWSEVSAASMASRSKAVDSPLDICAPGGESYASFRKRIAPAIEEILAAHRSESIAIVAHLGVVRTVLTDIALTDWDPQQRIGYCAVYRFFHRNGQLHFAGEATSPS